MHKFRKRLHNAMTELAEAADWDSIDDDADYDEALKDADAWPKVLSETDRTLLARTWAELVKLDEELSVRSLESTTTCRSRITPDGPQ